MTQTNDTGYIHTYTPEEQQRLMDQALFLEPYHHPNIDFRQAKTVLEVGCGVGAQMRVLLRRWPHVQIVGVEPSEAQIATARVNLADAIQAGRAALHQAAGDALPFEDNSFDGACVFWVFEHLSQPLPILREILRVLKPGAALYTTEVFDRAVHTYPECPAMMAYFQAFVALQASFGGDPHVGIRMPGLFAEAGFRQITTVDVSPTLDARMAEAAARKAFLDYFQTLLLSGSGLLIERGLIAAQLVEQVRAEFALLSANPSAVFSYGAKQTWGVKG